MTHTQTTLEEVERRLGELFRRVFGNPQLTWHRGLTAWDVNGWDSLSNLELIVTIEKEFSLRFITSETLRLRDSGDLADLVHAKLLGRAGPA